MIRCFAAPSIFTFTSYDELKTPNEEVYTSSYTSGFPSFSIYTVSAENWGGGRSNRPGTYNDKDKFDFYFTLTKTD